MNNIDAFTQTDPATPLFFCVSIEHHYDGPMETHGVRQCAFELAGSRHWDDVLRPTDPGPMLRMDAWYVGKDGLRLRLDDLLDHYGVASNDCTDLPTFILEPWYTLPVDIRDTIMTNPDKVPTDLYQLVSASNIVFGGVSL